VVVGLGGVEEPERVDGASENCAALRAELRGRAHQRNLASMCDRSSIVVATRAPTAPRPAVAVARMKCLNLTARAAATTDERRTESQKTHVWPPSGGTSPVGMVWRTRAYR
jgi:hypothetical protein